MKVKVIIGGVLLAGVLAGVPYLLPSDFKIEKSTFIQAKPAQVFASLNNLSAWEKWSAWNQHADPTLSNFYQGPVSGVGSAFSWKSGKSGEGRIVITANEPDKKIEFQFYPEGKLQAHGQFILEPVEKGTRLTWISTGILPDYTDRVKGVFLKRKLDAEFEKGLSGLKELLEPQAKKISLRK
ncbi:SRPBCC family protein [Adhaeribacter soli]|uniref:SRPBCC family protein n=1 Tax=Adhaeribacter soli TaxID=2607655 RepID=A0A5N1J7Y1_9BACT|nr:SRPBCC family protein [Adhaeribacter soli]KAA9346082.1 SRPBCC family protein [Adhaeribacter soli]